MTIIAEANVESVDWVEWNGRVLLAEDIYEFASLLLMIILDITLWHFIYMWRINVDNVTSDIKQMKLV